jgi:hypothetical protein
VCILTLAPLVGYIAMPSLAALVLTLLIPLQYATLIGVGLAVVLHVIRQSNKVIIRRRAFDGDQPFPLEPTRPHGSSLATSSCLSPTAACSSPPLRCSPHSYLDRANAATPAS